MKKITLLLIAILPFNLCGQIGTEIVGCTDEQATNYDTSAQLNDGTCTYAVSAVTPSLSWTLPDTIQETSGLISWDNKFWTHNDNGDIHLYSFDTSNINGFQKNLLPGTVNTDWEEISQDDQYIYVGDFGNNANGNRTDLKILRINKASIATSPLIDTISFSYALQSDFTAKGGNNSDFDCEAFITGTDSIYLFTKEWVSKKTSIYTIPKTPGTYTANFKSSFDVQGLITGATYLESKKLVALCGYSTTLQPFIYLLYDFKNADFFNGNKRKISISLSFHQVEGITTIDGLKYYATNEKFVQGGLSNDQKFHQIDLTTYLTGYLNASSTNIEENTISAVTVFPNPTKSKLFIETQESLIGEDYFIVNLNGNILLQGKLNHNPEQVDLSGLAKGAYLLEIKNQNPTKIVVE